MYFPVCCNGQLPPPPTIRKKKVVARLPGGVNQYRPKASLSLSKLSTRLRQIRAKLVPTHLRSSTPLPRDRLEVKLDGYRGYRT